MENDRFKSVIGKALEQESSLTYQNLSASIVEQNLFSVDICNFSSNKILSVANSECTTSILGSGEQLTM